MNITLSDKIKKEIDSITNKFPNGEKEVSNNRVIADNSA